MTASRYTQSIQGERAAVDPKNAVLATYSSTTPLCALPETPTDHEAPTTVADSYAWRGHRP